jgi:phage shock protein PspC (stress-responsive transcriptional regulator)
VTPFEHLSVLISIVIGMGIAQLLYNAHQLVQVRARLRAYWLTTLWFVLIFTSLIEWWWALFGLRTTTVWNFFYFLFMLLSPVSMYLAAAFVLPDEQERNNETIDLRRYYYENAGWMFAALSINPLLDAIRRGLQAGTIRDSGASINALAFLLVASLAMVKRPWYHAVVSLAVAALFLSFIVSSALLLRA